MNADGEPRASPVWYAHAGYREFLWVSRPATRHSRNIVVRPQVAIVIFDSTAPVGAAQAVYVEAWAEQLAAAERARAIEIYSRRCEAAGLRTWTATDVTAPAAHRLYRTTATAHYSLGKIDRRVPIALGADTGQQERG